MQDHDWTKYTLFDEVIRYYDTIWNIPCEIKLDIILIFLFSY